MPGSRRPSSIFAVAALALLSGAAAAAQRYSGLSSPPTAPPQAQSGHQSPTGPIVPVSSGLGAIQFYAVNYGILPPQSLTRQLTSSDERLRRAALAAIGAPSQYTQPGNVPFPHSMQLELAPLGNSDDEDALLTVELEHHLVTAILIPQGEEWRRVATVVFPTAYADTSTTPSTFLRTTRSLLEPNRYRAIFRARENQSNGDYVENEAHVRIIGNKPIVTSSFVDESRTCVQPPAGTKEKNASPASCEFVHRWLQPDVSQPGVRRFQLVTASGSISSRDLNNPLGTAHDFMMAHFKSYSCQPFVFSDATQHYEASGPSGACKKTPQPR